ncbi:MAG: hypothetical protein Q9187_007228 [Circinaria calcarea]
MSGVSLSPLTATASRSSTAPLAGKPRHHHIHHPHRHRRRQNHGVPHSATLPPTHRGLGDLVRGTTGDAIKGIGDWDWAAGRTDFGLRAPHMKDGEVPGKYGNAGWSRTGMAAWDWAATAGETKVEDEKEREKETRDMWNEVSKLRERRRQVESHLLTALSTLSTLGTTLTRRLDYTYYSFLSSLPLIHSTLADLSVLSQQATDLHARFTQSAIPSLIGPITAQVAANRQSFDNEIQDRITRLEGRMRGARLTAQDLGRRIESTRKKVEVWEAERIEGKRRSRRNVQVLWGILGGLVGLFLVVVVVRGWSGDGVGGEIKKEIEGVNATARLAELERLHVAEGAAAQSESTYAEPRNPTSSEQVGAKGDVDPRLRLFDEL